MKLLERLFGPHHDQEQTEIPIEEIKEDAARKRDEAEAAVRRWAPDVARRAEVADAIRQAQRRRQEA